jgi:type VI secretion system protein ImpK
VNSEQDPFGHYPDDDKTIVRPNPGGRRNTAAQTPPPSFTPPVADIPEPLRNQLSQATGNPLTGHAVALLSLACQLRNAVSHPDINGLRNSVINEIKHFENNLRSQNVSTEQIQAARYALCTLLDEAVLNTPWGGNSIWSTQSLLITFHKEAWGGEKFFLILKNAMQHPALHLHLLELLFFCLALGFQGKYRVLEHGSSQLEEIRENLFQIIQLQHEDPERDLSVHWQGIKDQRNVLAKFVPLWVIGAVSAVLLMLIYFVFLFLISNSADAVLQKLYAVKDNLTTAPVVDSGQNSAATPAAEFRICRVFLRRKWNAAKSCW